MNQSNKFIQPICCLFQLVAMKMENWVGVNYAIFCGNTWRQFIAVKTLVYMKMWNTKFSISGPTRLKMSEPVTYYFFIKRHSFSPQTYIIPDNFPAI